MPSCAIHRATCRTRRNPRRTRRPRTLSTGSGFARRRGRRSKAARSRRSPRRPRAGARGTGACSARQKEVVWVERTPRPLYQPRRLQPRPLLPPPPRRHHSSSSLPLPSVLTERLPPPPRRHHSSSSLPLPPVLTERLPPPPLPSNSSRRAPLASIRVADALRGHAQLHSVWEVAGAEHEEDVAEHEEDGAKHEKDGAEHGGEEAGSKNVCFAEFPLRFTVTKAKPCALPSSPGCARTTRTAIAFPRTCHLYVPSASSDL